MVFESIKEAVFYKIEEFKYQLDDGMSLQRYRRTLEESEYKLIDAVLDELLDKLDKIDWGEDEEDD